MNVGLLARRVGVIAVIYASLILGVAPFVLALHETIRSPGGVSSANLALEVLLLSTALSAGPFIYLGVVRRTQWLQDHQSKGLTHELKSPLDAIQSAVEIILERIEKNPAETKKIADYVRMVDNNAVRMNKLVGNLLSVAKLDDEAIVLNRNEVDLERIVSNAIEGVRSQIDRKAISIDLSYMGNCRVVGDEEKIGQVVSNLLGNAVKFSAAGVIRVRLSHYTGDVEFSVEDAGSGISADELVHVFDRYYQGKNSSRGSGLGLTISKAWVEAHGGQIWAESEGEGKGTTVTFTLPSGDI